MPDDNQHREGGKRPGSAVWIAMAATASVALWGLLKSSVDPIPREKLAQTLTTPRPLFNKKVSLEEGFADPPMTARPSTYYVLLNGYVNRDHVPRELQDFYDTGLGGLCIFDMGAHGAPETVPPAGPPFLSPESVKNLGQIIKKAGALGMEVDLSVSSSWDMGGSWVQVRDGSMGLFTSQTEIVGPTKFNGVLPLPPLPNATPRNADGTPQIKHEVAVLAIPQPVRMPGHDFVFKLPGGSNATSTTLARIVFQSVKPTEGEPTPAKDFLVSVSNTTSDDDAFVNVLRGSLKAQEEPQEFKLPPRPARYVRLRILNGHDANMDRIQLSEVELFAAGKQNMALGYAAGANAMGAELIRATTPTSRRGDWAPQNIHDGRVGLPKRRWASSGPPPLVIADSKAIVDLSERTDKNGRLRWDVPEGKWVIQRFLCTNTGETLKVPSPGSNGLATDHLSKDATRRYIEGVVERLRPEIGDFRHSALKELYLASYEVVGQIWTPTLLDEFKKRRNYDFLRYLPTLEGSVVDGKETTDRVAYDFRKTMGELLVDAYYRAAGEAAHAAGINIESEAGGPGPPTHEVPVDSLLALGTMDAVRGEFWPFRPDAHALWVVKETASAAHIYGKPRVHMEAFTSSYHWYEAPSTLKAAADRAFCEGMNHVVWHTASHHPPEAGKPGWVYGAGTHLGPNNIWWPMARVFHDYLSRTSFMLQQGRFVADVLYYYGDHGFNFVLPRGHDPRIDDASRGIGHDYDVTNAEVILSRLETRDGKLTLPDGLSYEVLVLPNESEIDPDVLQKVEKLVAAGATVIGPKPKRATGFSTTAKRDEQVRDLAETVWGNCDGRAVLSKDHGIGKVVCGGAVKDVLGERGMLPDFVYKDMNDGANAPAELDYIHRRTDDAEIYFVRNKKPLAENVTATFRVQDMHAEIWRPDSGETFPYPLKTTSDGRSQLSLHMGPEDAFFVVFRPGKTAKPGNGVRYNSVTKAGASPDGPEVDWLNHGGTPVAFAAGTYEIEQADGTRKDLEITGLPVPVAVAGPWKVTFPSGLGAPPAIEMTRLVSWTEHADPGVRYFSGIAEYQTEFDLSDEWLGDRRRVILDLGKLWAMAEVVVNGKKMGILWKEPYRLDVTSAVKAGKNELRVKVANTWANRIIGDALNPKDKPIARTNITQGVPDGREWKDVQTLPSGLFGPVVLVAGEVFPN